jgi:hypothetical protein
MAVCFSPEADCAAVAVRAIDGAEREIFVSAYGLTTGSGVVEALARAKGRGVDVRLIAVQVMLIGVADPDSLFCAHKKSSRRAVLDPDRSDLANRPAPRLPGTGYTPRAIRGLARRLEVA